MKAKTILLKTAITGCVKVCSAFIAFFMTIAVTRTLDTYDSGLFLLALSFLAASSVFFRMGLDDPVVRFISTSSNSEEVSDIMLTAVCWVFLFSLSVSAILFFFSENISDFISKPEFNSMFCVMVWALPCMAVFSLLAYGFQSFHRVIVTTFFQNLGISLFFLVFFLVFWFVDPSKLTGIFASYIFLVSAILVLLMSLFMWLKQVNWHMGKLKFVNAKLWCASSNLWIASVMFIVVQWSGVLIAGAFVSPEEIAFLTTAQRTALLTSFILMIVNMVVAPRYAQLWNDNDLVKIRRLAQLSARGMILLVLPIMIVMLFFPHKIMILFGEGYEQGALLLSILSLGQFVNVATGSVAHLLNMTGHEKDFKRVALIAGPLTVVLCFVLNIKFGVIGAAIATAVGLSIQNLGALVMVKRRLGFWPIR